MAPPSRHSGARSPISAKLCPPSAVKFSPLFSETKLVLAIQTLDATWKSSKCQSIPPANEENCTNECAVSTLLSGPVREALCTLLEISAGLDKPELLTKSQLVTICTARVLGCLKRFVANWTDTKKTNFECCNYKCEQRLIDLVLLTILFRMCRESEIARSVVKEGLHKFLIRMCSVNEMWNPDLNVDVEEKQVHVAGALELETFDPNDLMLAIDPFDWCYQPLCTRLMIENTSAFIIPVGVQSLIRLLRGCSLPIDEVSEFEQQIHTNKGARTKRTKHQKLPSMFTFPLHDKDEVCTLANTPHKVTSFCWETRSTLCKQREICWLWSVVLNDGSSRHLALRSVITLTINLPQPSAEYRSLIGEREYICRLLRAYNRLPSSQCVLAKAALWLSPENASDVDTPRVELPPYQLAATKGSTLKSIARSALSLFAEVQHAAVSISKHQEVLQRRKALCPISTKRVHGKEELYPGNCDPLSIRQRLNGAANAAKSEIAQWEHKYVNDDHSLDVERNRRRLGIRKMCADVESHRRHLLGSLAVLCSGRQHPDPQQPFSEWIKSLPTLETLERELQSQQEMRQRHILELQYQREALRRRERDECAQMQVNDYNVPKESELSIRQEQHERFVRMQAEMRQLEENDSDNLKNNCKDDANAVRTPTKKEKLAIQERQRLQKLEDQRREGRELERMRREDLYYVERILQAKAKEKEEQEKREKHTALHTNAIDEQRQRIARMRVLDEEKKKAKREIGAMRTEDLFGRQVRYREAEKAKEQVQNEWRERKAMQVEEQDGRARWTLWERALMQQQQEELKQQRAEARRLKRQQKREEDQIRAAWVESWDQGGNKYYYNAVTGVSQWEAPSEHQNT